MTAEQALERFMAIASDIRRYNRASQTRQFHLDNAAAYEAILSRIAVDAKDVAESVNGKEPKSGKKNK